jgi:hypothetical protein
MDPIPELPDFKIEELLIQGRELPPRMQIRAIMGYHHMGLPDSFISHAKTQFGVFNHLEKELKRHHGPRKRALVFEYISDFSFLKSSSDPVEWRGFVSNLGDKFGTPLVIECIEEIASKRQADLQDKIKSDNCKGYLEYRKNLVENGLPL